MFYWLISGFFVRVLVALAIIAFIAYSAKAWRVQS
jgi:hypothetical protein